jgi:ketosteroid isomerase-like protein
MQAWKAMPETLQFLGILFAPPRISPGMSTASKSQPDVATLDRDLNKAILGGDILNAFEKFYANDVVMQENDSEPFNGKEVNRKREEDFVNSVEQLHGAKLVGEAVNGDRSYSEWEYDVTFKGGKRTKMQQVAARLWRNGQVVHERFYYKGGQ